jgi:hypothetical protein
MMRARFWFETTVSAICGALFVLTLVWRDWIEIVFGADPDHGSGALEWAIVASTFVVCFGGAIAARREFRVARGFTA